MVALNRLNPPARRPAPHAAQAALDPRSRALLDLLRQTALRCRSAARSDLFEACAVLSCTRAVAGPAYAEALMRNLDQALGHTPLMHRPGVVEMSFDEAWLLRALAAARHEDLSSFHFLLRSRVTPSARRNLGFLICCVAERLSRT